VKVKIPKVGRQVSRFNLSHNLNLSCDMGKLIPILCEEVVPSDTFQVNTEMLLRLSPLVTPVMHEINVYTDFFFVPNRLIWDDFEDFITGGEDGTDATSWPFLSIGTSDADPGTLADYFGLPDGSNSYFTSALPFRAYALIYNEWYRDQNIQTTKTVLSTGNGSDSSTSKTLLSRNWAKDYFTSCLPNPQKGTAVDLPLGTSAPLSGTAWVKGIGVDTGKSSRSVNVDVHESDGTDPTYAGAHDFSLGTNAMYAQAEGSPDYRPNIYADLSSVTADLSSATAATINELRNALAIQKFMERAARGGSRYHESTLMNFGVLTPDHRLGRPEYLGGGKSPVVISEVLQTSATSGSDYQGSMAGHAISATSGHGFRKSFTEHGWIIGIMSVMPKTQYQQGIPRKYRRTTKYHYLWPDFVNIGEQAVLNEEIYVDAATPSDTFGYQERYAEYRYIPSRTSGEFRDTSGLANWHMGRIFASEPSLNSSFITCDPTVRVFANQSDHTCLVQMHHSISALRPLPKYAEPSL
jgi:hypothetical protein